MKVHATGVVLALLATTVLIGLRIAAAPTAAGYRHAMAAAPNGDLYEAQPGRGLVLATAGGNSVVEGPLPGGLPLALAADGQRLLLGTDQGLYQSADGGAHWSTADRKSTRLNSSHPSISYAVFCLKKKKQYIG